MNEASRALTHAVEVEGRPPVGACNCSPIMSLTFNRSSADRTAHDFGATWPILL
jgi:hypothetical protein